MTYVEDSAPSLNEPGPHSVNAMASEGPGDGAESGLEAIVDILRVLKDGERREVYEFLRTFPRRTMALEELAEHVAEGEETTGLETRLYHVHLPKLAEVGLIEFEPKRGRLRYLGDRDVELILDWFDDAETSSSTDG